MQRQRAACHSKMFAMRSVSFINNLILQSLKCSLCLLVFVIICSTPLMTSVVIVCHNIRRRTRKYAVGIRACIAQWLPKEFLFCKHEVVGKVLSIKLCDGNACVDGIFGVSMRLNRCDRSYEQHVFFYYRVVCHRNQETQSWLRLSTVSIVGSILAKQLVHQYAFEFVNGLVISLIQ